MPEVCSFDFAALVRDARPSTTIDRRFWILGALTTVEARCIVYSWELGEHITSEDAEVMQSFIKERERRLGRARGQA